MQTRRATPWPGPLVRQPRSGLFVSPYRNAIAISDTKGHVFDYRHERTTIYAQWAHACLFKLMIDGPSKTDTFSSFLASQIYLNPRARVDAAAGDDPLTDSNLI